MEIEEKCLCCKHEACITYVGEMKRNITQDVISWTCVSVPAYSSIALLIAGQCKCQNVQSPSIESCEY